MLTSPKDNQRLSDLSVRGISLYDISTFFLVFVAAIVTKGYICHSERTKVSKIFNGCKICRIQNILVYYHSKQKM